MLQKGTPSPQFEEAMVDKKSTQGVFGDILLITYQKQTGNIVTATFLVPIGGFIVRKIPHF